MHTQKNETAIYYAILYACLLLAIILFYFFYSIIKYHKRDLKDKLETIYGKNGILEAEKKRIGREMHDGISSSLAGIKLLIESIESESGKDQKKLLTISENLDAILGNFRYILNDLMDINLTNKDLKTHLIDYIEKINSSTYEDQLTINHDIENIPIHDKTKALHIYRIFQEVIYNAQKHSKASSLEIKSFCTAQDVNISFKDNGNGFDMNTTLHTKTGIGINNIIYRTEMLNGTPSIHSEIDRGTEIILKIPL
jgi:signal transduction histidine kinase